MGQAGSRRDNGISSVAAVKFVEKLLEAAKTGCIALPESFVAPHNICCCRLMNVEL
jgi:hypothetical protein